MIKDNIELHYYKYKGKIGKRLKKTTGHVVAENEKEAIKKIKELGVKYIQLKDVTPFLYQQFKLKKEKIPEQELALFFEKLGAQMEFGISPTKCLDNFMYDNFQFDTFLFIAKIKHKLEQGYSLTDSIKSTNMIDRDIISLVYIGEESGNIVKVLNEIASLYKEQYTIKQKIKKSMIKPILLIISVLAILIFVVPIMLNPIKSISAQFAGGAGIPKITQIVMSITDYITNYWYIVFGVLFVIAYLHIYMYKYNYKYKYQIDNFLLNAPLFGRLSKSLFIYLTLLNLEILYKSGTTLERSFDMIVKAQKNEEFKLDLEEVKMALTHGNSLYQAINVSGYFPKIYKDMLKQGEETGKMAKELTRSKKMAKEEFNIISTLFVDALSKTIGGIVSIIIGIVIIAVYMPMFSIISAVTSHMN